jgi:hypothetical protein
MAEVNWPQPGTRITLRGGSVAIYKGVHAVTGKHEARDGETSWLLDAEGFARADHEPCPQDWVGELP